MNPARGTSEHAALFDSAAEALIMVDLNDAATVDELIGCLDALVVGLGVADDAHPACLAAAAARELVGGDASLLLEIERAYSVARRDHERGAKEPARTETPGSESSDAEDPAEKRASDVVPASSAMPLAGDEELLRDFAIRAREHLDDADEQLLALESDPLDGAAVDAVFRAFHTIKGMAGFLSLDAISQHAHDAESLLAEPRADHTAVSAEAVQALLTAVDVMRSLVFEATGIGEAIGVADDTAQDVAEPSARPSEPTRAATGSREGIVRIEEARLDALLDTIGEMVIAESMVSAGWRNGEDAGAVAAQIDRLDKISRELQQMATSLRMVPLRATFKRMARLVRDLAHKAGKTIDFVVTGEDTELDKVVVDRIYDPLVHALRNAVDHGIESAEERVAAGKSETARIELRAYHAGGAIHIEVSDDGRGLDRARITERAIQLGLIGEGEQLDEAATFALVFEPGFSTADEVTEVSGRGVGMDVVRRSIQELRGNVDLSSKPGRGTTLSVRLPITLAIIEGMVARVGDERYIIPILSIERSVRPASDQVSTVAGRAEMLDLGDSMLPILRLGSFFGSTDSETDLTDDVIVIVDDNGVRAGLFVSELLGQQQTVIKPLGDGLPDQPGITGGAIMPDGRVGLILDVAGLVRIAQTKGR